MAEEFEPQFNYEPLPEPTNWDDVSGLNKAENRATRSQIFAQNSAPTKDYKEGDIWFDADDNNTIYRANSALSWVSVKDGTILVGATTTFFQAGIPTSLAIGDLWIDSDDGNKLYRAASVGADQIIAGEWIEVQDDAIATAATTANWSGVADDDSNKPDNNATIGATTGVSTANLSGQPAFGGDGSDGALSVTVDTALDFNSANILIKNYTSITIDVSKILSASNVPTSGGVMWLKTTGNVTINGTITMAGKGSAGGTGGAGSDGPGAGGDGSAPTEPYYTISNIMGEGGLGSPAVSNVAGGGGGGGGFKTNGTAGSNGGTGATGGAAGVKLQGYNLFMSQYPKSILFAIGCGGGGGGGGEYNGGTGGDGGSGGAGGGVLIIECKCNLAFGVASVINVGGVNGSDGEDVTRDGGGGGGGSGGLVRIFYNGTLTDSGVTKTVAAGSGGASVGGGAGGAGSIGEVFIEKNTFIV